MNETPVAGIRFSVVDSKVTAGQKTKFQGTVTLTAHYNREDLWSDIVARFNGLEMHRGGDIQSELIAILQGQVDMLEAELASKGNADLVRAQRAEQAASIAQSDKVRAVQQAELLTAQMAMKTRELEDAYEKLREWDRWLAIHKLSCPSFPR